MFFLGCSEDVSKKIHSFSDFVGSRAGWGFIVPAVVASQELLLLLGVTALLPQWIVCSRDCGNCFSYQPILKSSQDLTSALLLLAGWHCTGKGVLQPWK